MQNRNQIENNEAQFFNQQQDLNNTLLKAASVSYNNGDEFYREYSDFIATLSHTFEDLQLYSQKKLTDLASSQEEARAKGKRDLEFVRDADEFIRGKTNDLGKKNQFHEDVKTKLKEAISAIDYKKVAKLKVKNSPQLETLFQTLFNVFYKDAKNTFNWDTYCKIAITQNKLEDFKNRLINQDFSLLNEEEIESLQRLHDDQWYDNFSKTDKSGAPVLDILNYLEYVKEAAKNQNEINALTHEITRIKADAPLRAETSKSDAIWADLVQQNITHIENLTARMVFSAEPFAQEANRTNQQATNYDQHKREVTEAVQGQYSQVQYVPRNIYSDS